MYHPSHAKALTSEAGVMEAMCARLPVEWPPPFCGNPVRRQTSVFQRPRGGGSGTDASPEPETASPYRFGGKKWDIQPVPEEFEEHFREAFAIYDTLVPPEDRCGRQANVAVVQIYHKKQDGSISWHSDNEEVMARDPDTGEVLPIVSISFGASAEFRFKPIELPEGAKRRKTEGIVLKDGDVVVMHKGCQEKQQHCIEPGGIAKDCECRISFTLRVQD